MKRIIVTLSGLLMITAAAMAHTEANDEETLMGSWVFNVTGAPWEYSKGIITFGKDDENNILGNVVFDNTSRELNIARVTVEGGTATFETVVDGYRVITYLTIDENNLTGHVETDEGNMDISAEREISEG